MQRNKDTGRFEKELLDRTCYACGSSKTRIDKRGLSVWIPNRPTDLALCKKCFSRHISNPIYNKRFHKIHNPRRMKFKDRIVTIARNPRIGVCNWCRAVVPTDVLRTDMHHEQYIEGDPLKYAIELCTACHNSTKNHKRGKRC